MYHSYPYPSKRSAVYAPAMALASTPLAAEAGRTVLEQGGNAIDAAIAMAAAQTVVEPTSNGLGSDLFTVFSFGGALYGFNGSGKSPASISPEALQKKGFDKIPPYGIEPVGVPGAVDAWRTVHEAFGALSFLEVLAPAIRYAKDGFVISPTVSALWARELRTRKHCTGPVFDAFWHTFAPEGRAPRPGEIFSNPDQAETLIAIAESKTEAFYRGTLAEKISEFSATFGGFLSAADLAAHQTLRVEPLSLDFEGTTVYELPPNGHGISVLMALAMLKPWKIDLDTPLGVHRTVEAVKRAMTDCARFVTDPDHMRVRCEDLLSDAFIRRRRNDIADTAKIVEYCHPLAPSTVYFAVGDTAGNMVSMIQSNYDGFGSGVVVPGTGISLNNRLLNFSLEAGHDNILAGGKRPYHTIIPGFLTKDGAPYAAFGVMGGFMQPQGHVQTLLRLLVSGANPQAALDAPRFMWTGEDRIACESTYAPEILDFLRASGHAVTIPGDELDMGRGQILVRENGVYCGGTEKRCDGYIAALY